VVRLAIHDTGIGISPENQGRLFVNFNQADASIARRFGGTGLGLAITRQIVQAMGGEIGVTSREGEGSTFYCTLPLKVDPARRRLPPANTASLAGVPVLVCGGPRLGRHVIAEWCRRWGMRVEECVLGQLGYRLKSHAAGSSALQLVVAGGVCESLAQAVSSFQANAGRMPPKLLLLTSDPPEKARGLPADAVLATPVRAKVLSAKLRELILPQAHNHAMAQAACAPAIGQGTAGQQAAGKLLVADDNLINQRLACALLARLGYQVDTADTGAEAVEKVGLGGYALVFMDCVMPEMDGFEAASAIRQLAGKCAAVPIVALTASATTEDRAKCMAAGMNDFVAKPVRSEDLASALSKWLKN
jgi:CheY-like chemotaxis protein